MSILICHTFLTASLWSCNLHFNSRFTFLLDVGVAIAVSGPLMIPLVIVYLYACFALQRYTMELLRELARLKAITSSPIIQSFSEAVVGSKSIRAFGEQARMLSMFETTVDDYTKNQIHIIATKQWFAVRVQFVTLLIVLPAIAIAVNIHIISGFHVAKLSRTTCYTVGILVTVGYRHKAYAKH